MGPHRVRVKEAQPVGLARVQGSGHRSYSGLNDSNRVLGFLIVTIVESTSTPYSN